MNRKVHQKSAVLWVLESLRPHELPDEEQIYRRASAILPGLSHAATHRVLSELVSSGRIAEVVQTGQPTRYDVAPSGRVYLHLSDLDRTDPLSLDLKDALERLRHEVECHIPEVHLDSIEVVVSGTTRLKYRRLEADESADQGGSSTRAG
ncbi:Fe2+ or Zn2+ uptake regulation protein [Deinobacterium chartae]|uniref:Fe2+ or Zn2+ uptake regulation protein n=1 Tax=Deinobacterium chartae TaxID=521158 RepID=A0A841HZ31_9DEIO|nr:hypothetical protein [Deinobacterium chartae]MBB6097470.1 Fe2+ or Zn2+ uptake regulation protein [Deinobacterium chartae]